MTTFMLMIGYASGIALVLGLVGAAARRADDDMADLLYAVPERGDPFAGRRPARMRPVSAPRY
jgi:hypothetical protein